MKCIAIGTNSFLASCISGFIEAGVRIELIISMPLRDRPDNSYDLENYAQTNNIDYMESRDINSAKIKNKLITLQPDLILSSWPRILDSEFLKIPLMGVLGSHPSDLPHNRGRHPLHWQIVLGIKESSLSFFWVDEGVDTGRVVLKKNFFIEPNQTIQELVDKVDTLGNICAREIALNILPSKNYIGVKQDLSISNILRKRDRHDIFIDFRMNHKDIVLLVNSFSHPYPCAKVIYMDKVFDVISASTNYVSQDSLFAEHGKVFGLNGKKLSVKASGGIVNLTLKQNIGYLTDKIKYIHPPTKYLSMFPNLNF